MNFLARENVPKEISGNPSKIECIIFFNCFVIAIYTNGTKESKFTFLGTAPVGAPITQVEGKVGNIESSKGNERNAEDNIPNQVFDEDNLRSCQV